MRFYEVLVSSPRFHGKGALTYSSSDVLQPGQVVSVELQKQAVLGLVNEEVVSPNFKTKEIIKTVSNTPLPKQSLRMINWLIEYYPAPLGQIVSLFLPSTLMQESRKKAVQSPEEKTKTPSLPKLTDEQSAVLENIIKSDAKSYLLHGETGTGKTRVYLELIQTALESGRSALVLTPEIGLTPQLFIEVKKYFPGKVLVFHSDLTPAQRRKTWLNILESPTPLIVIGPRSALFSPLANIGFVAVDEFHDSAYKQEQTPHYLTSRVAATLANFHGAKLVLGSATPSVSDYYAFEQKSLPILRMVKPAVKSTLPLKTDITTVDLRDREQFSRSSWLSNKLLEGIENCLGNREQSLIFLNRRGTARLVVCQQCSWQAVCPRCDLPLTYHGDSHRMQCHTCGFSDRTPPACPVCKSTEIIFRSIGTKALYSELERLFPKARILRFDSDTTKSNSLERHYEAVRDGEVDILVGTQLLSKGLDLPRLALVGVVAADTSLYFPDYTAEERTYQMLSQIIGRVGRGHTAGTVIVQTYHPDSPVITSALQKDYSSFYEQQIKERQAFSFPPFSYILKIYTERSSKAAAERTAKEIATKLNTSKLKIAVSGPAPSFVEKVNNRYRWQVIVRANNRKELTKAIQLLPSNCNYDIDPIDLL